MEYWIPAVLMAVIYSAMGRFVAHYPETKSGYSTMSAERKKYVDIQAAGRCVARFFTAAGYISLAGALAAIPGIQENWSYLIFGTSMVIPIILLLFAAGWAPWKYDRKFLKRFKKMKN